MRAPTVVDFSAQFIYLEKKEDDYFAPFITSSIYKKKWKLIKNIFLNI